MHYIQLSSECIGFFQVKKGFLMQNCSELLQMCILILQEEGMVNSVLQTDLTIVIFFFIKHLLTPTELVFCRYGLKNSLHFRRNVMTRMIVKRKQLIRFGEGSNPRGHIYYKVHAENHCNNTSDT